MNQYLLLFILFVLIEIILAFIFSWTAQIYYKKVGIDMKSVIKGTIERLFLVVMLCNSYTQALTLFSALKLATRLKHDEKENASENRFNDYYLIGNFVSVCCAVFYVYLITNIHAIPILNRLIGYILVR